MLAAVLKDFDQLVLEDVPVPEPHVDEALVRIKACGICATDYKAICGIRRNVTFPLIPGHEPSGIIAKLGSGVKGFAEGDEVIVQPSGGCGHCKFCRIGQSNYCPEGYTTGGDGPPDTRPGSFAEYTIVRSGALYHKPAQLSYDEACQTEPLSGAWKGIIKMSEMKVGDDVVIIGTGGIGIYCLMVAKAAGAGRLIAVDVSDWALDTARKLGATHTVNPMNGDVKRQIFGILPDGPDLVLEAAGPIEAVKAMVSLLRQGTRWNIFGITTHEKFEMDGGLMHFLEARMDASFGTNPEAMFAAIRLMERGIVNPELAISHRFDLKDIQQAMEVMGQKERNKVIIHP